MHLYLCADDASVGTFKEHVSPSSFQHIKLDMKKAKEFPELLEVLKCHSRSTDFIYDLVLKKAAHRGLRLQGL
jgi:hypothetical protein